MTRAEITDLLTWAQAVDGHQRGVPDVEVWLDAAARGRWSRTAAADAIRAVGARFTGYRLMPGHVDEQIRADRRHPAPVAQVRAAIEGTPPAADETRAAVVADFVAAMARRKSAPAAFEPTIQSEPGPVVPAPRPDRFAGVDACDQCDAAGMRLDDPSLVCTSHYGRTGVSA